MSAPARRRNGGVIITPMILFLDIKNDGAVAGAVDAEGAKWVSVAGDRAGLRALAKAKTVFGLARRKPTSVVVSMNAPDATRDVSWSGIRAGVATANALAFAWGVPVAGVLVSGDESKDELARRVRAAAESAKKGIWVAAAYDGEPNITVAKKIL
jgi:hypothetical protein